MTDSQNNNLSQRLKELENKIDEINRKIENLVEMLNEIKEQNKFSSLAGLITALSIGVAYIFFALTVPSLSVEIDLSLVVWIAGLVIIFSCLILFFNKIKKFF